MRALLWRCLPLRLFTVVSKLVTICHQLAGFVSLLHTLTTRPPTFDEQRRIAARAKPDVASAGCLLAFAAGLACGLGAFGHWLGTFISPVAAQYGQWIGWAVAVVVSVPFAISVIRYARRQRELAQSDNDNQAVQDIYVRIVSLYHDITERVAAAAKDLL